MLGELLLKVSVEFQGVFLRDNDAYLLIISVEVPQNALGHALKTALDQAIGHDNVLNEGLKTAGNIEVAHLE